MTSNKQPWIHHGLAVAAFILGVALFFALIQMGAGRWTTSVSVLSLALILVATNRTKMRSTRNSSIVGLVACVVPSNNAPLHSAASLSRAFARTQQSSPEAGSSAA
jgi:hypothetical protein